MVMNKARSRRRYVFRMVASGLAFFLLFGWVILVVPLRRALSHHPILYRYQLYRRMHAVPDVVFIGHSRTAVAVDPSFVDSYGF